MLQRVGKIAFKTLIYGNSFARSNLIQYLGGDAFNYGLIIGHEDHRSSSDGQSKIAVTFLEKGMQDFLGAFYFTCMLDTGKSLEELLGPSLKNPVLTTNPLFLHFCLWLLKRSELHFPLRHHEYVYQRLQSFIGDRFKKDEQVRDVESLCHALNFPRDAVLRDQLTETFFEEIITQWIKLSETDVKDAEGLKGGTSGM